MIGPNLSEWGLKRPSLVIFMMIVAVVAGILSFVRLGRSEDPAITIRTMVVAAAWPGATVEETLKQVTERLERTLQETRHLDRIRSYTTAGQTTIFVDLKQSAPPSQIADVWYQVRKNVGDMWLLAMLAGLADAPPIRRRWVRALLVAGPIAFIAVGVIGVYSAGAFLGYREGWAKPLILVVEFALMPSLAFTLGLVMAGAPERLEYAQ